MKFTVALPPPPDSQVEGGLLLVKIEGGAPIQIVVPKRAFAAGPADPIDNARFETPRDDTPVEVQYFWLRDSVEASLNSGLAILPE